MPSLKVRNDNLSSVGKCSPTRVGFVWVEHSGADSLIEGWLKNKSRWIGLTRKGDRLASNGLVVSKGKT